MQTIRTILHPTDFSEHSAYAFRLACVLAQGSGAKLILMHVAAPPTAVTHAVLLPLLAEHEHELKKELNRLVPNAGVPTERRLEQGDPATEILRVAKEIQADLIVIGTHGRTGFERLLMGSVAEQVLRSATCPVVTVRIPTTCAPSSDRR